MTDTHMTAREVFADALVRAPELLTAAAQASTSYDIVTHLRHAEVYFQIACYSRPRNCDGVPWHRLLEALRTTHVARVVEPTTGQWLREFVKQVLPALIEEARAAIPDDPHWHDEGSV